MISPLHGVSGSVEASCGQLHVLLLDGDDGFRRGLAENLRDDGHPVAEYGSALALPPFTSFPRGGIAIVEYLLPGGDGVRFADRLHAIYASMPVLLVTTSWTAQIAEQIASRRFLSLLPKPVDYGQLHKTVHLLASSPRPRVL